VPLRTGRDLILLHQIERYAVEQLVEAPSFKRKAAGSIPDGIIGIFH
jgi:hypothetical protein